VATELGSAYVSVWAETSKLETQIKAALDGSGKYADRTGSDIGKRISDSASKALKDGWRPDQDIMAGIPDTKLDRIGARIGQVIGKGVVGGLRAREAGVQFGNSFAQGAGSVGLGGVISRWHKELAGGGALNALGVLAGKSLSAGLTAAAGVGVAGIGLALTKGFDRLEKIDSAKGKLKSLGMSASEVADTVKIVTDSVTGTPYSLDAAFSTAVQAIGAGTKDVSRFMKDVTDAAGFAGDDLAHMGLVFTQILTKGKADGGDLMQLMEAGLPAKSWIEQSYNLTSDQFEKMQRDGQITLDMIQKSIEDHAPGMAKAAGNTLQGAIGNMQTAIARVGADFLSAIFGGASGDPTEGMKDAIARLSEMLNNLDNWIKAHRDDIREFFQSAKTVAADLLGVLGNIANALKEHPGLIKAVAVAFVAWESLKGIAAVAGAISTLNIALGSTAGLASAAYGPLAAIAAIIAGGAIGGLSAQDAVNANGANSEAGKNAQNQITAPGMGVPGASRDPIFGVPQAPESGRYRGKPGHSSDPTGGLISGGLTPGIGVPGVGGGGNGYIGNTNDPVERWRPMVKQALAQYGPQYGITNMSAWEQKMMTQIRTESAGNPSVFNNYDSNAQAGHPSRGLLQFIPSTFAQHNITGGDIMDPYAQIAAFIPYVSQRYGMDKNGSPFQVGRGVGYASGGGVRGAGSGTSDSIPAMLSHGEHVFSASDVQKMGGQSSVYSFRNALHRANGGAISAKSLEDMRTAGAIPAGAGSTAKAGTSAIAGAIDMGGEVINGIIDQAASAVSTAASAAAMAGSFGAAGPEGGMAAGSAAQFAIGLGTNAAKRGVTYGFDLLGIGADSLLQQLTPFGQPRWLNQDYTGFMPKQAITGALGNLMSGGAQQAADPAGSLLNPKTKEHGTMMGAAPGPIDNLMGNMSPASPSPMISDANSFLSTQPLAAEAPAPNQQPIFKVDNIYTQDVDSLGRELNKQGRLAQMQYTNRPGP
jgi:tape measure domain-containing protein